MDGKCLYVFNPHPGAKLAKADELIEDIMAEIRLALRKKDVPSQRRIILSVG